MILLITVVLFVTTVANYRNGGGREDVENGAGTIEDINMDNVGRNTNTSNGNMAVMDGNTDTSESFNNFQNRASVYYDLGQSYSPPRYGSVNTSNNRTSVYYDLGQSYSPPQPDPVNTSNNRTSVHYVSGDTDHPLRMNPADSIGSVRSIPPNVETPEQAGMHAVLGCIVPGCSCRWCTERRNAAHERATANSSSNSCAGIVEWLRCICLQ
ncbi:hypothetical protein N431DRAFT_64368 [Stipitochalara longipes BDJ]|nr:hypothetical protein N431DRAFT_64368 [Stipitochalara longipes BDJ]